MSEKKSVPLHIDYLHINGRTVPITVKHNPRARRIIVHVDLASGSVQVTAPSKRGLSKALLFAREQRDWIAERLESVPAPVPFTSGAHIFFHGREHVIRHAGTKRGEQGESGPVWRVCTSRTGGLPEIRVSGEMNFMQRRVKDWLQAQARIELNERALAYAEAMGVRPSRITVRDTTTRWGSCSPSRALSFSWRLIMAPPHVLDYVAAHEVAHLRHMNHGPRFWGLLASHVPHMEAAKKWLETQGPGLHRYGIDLDMLTGVHSR